MQSSKILDRQTLSGWNSDALYIIRIVAAQVVLVGHMFSYLGLTPLKNQAYFPYIQSLAVLVFFLLSGFLTDYSLHRKSDDYTYGQFIKDHLIRIYGAYFPALIFIVIVDTVFISRQPDLYPHYNSLSLEIFVKNLLMLPSTFTPLGSGRPLWTLYLEWWLYIAFGYMILRCRKKCVNSNLKITDIVILILLLYIPLKKANIMPLLAFLFGIIIRRVYTQLQVKGIWSICITVVFFVGWSSHIKDAYHITEAILIGLILLQILAYGNHAQSRLGDKGRKILRFMSGCTYPLYLTHYTVLVFMIYEFRGTSPWKIFWGCFIMSNMLSVILYVAVDAVTGMIRKGK